MQWLRSILLACLLAPLVLGAAPDDLVPTGNAALSPLRGTRQRTRRRRMFIASAQRTEPDLATATLARHVPRDERDRFSGAVGPAVLAPGALLPAHAPTWVSASADGVGHRATRCRYLWNCALLL